MTKTHPKGAILDLEELQNIAILGLDVWEWDIDMARIEHRTKPKIRQTAGGRLLSFREDSGKYVQWFHIPDPTYTVDGATGSIYLFNSEEEAQAVERDYWRERFKSRGLMNV